ncbi:hypothetical protein BJ508DRAFT_363214 [Ascobolus immersus RN42]|uniref:Uncharacterized protein n=1 Tax=Ascobolus immersus RN42 TaxID=1160509 RepID=A0A3N4I1K1_ASCIM|nr:hypothetical protein BJ508DRAFT_363214 [Ascobolus immersus RN42]
MDHQTPPNSTTPPTSPQPPLDDPERDAARNRDASFFAYMRSPEAKKLLTFSTDPEIIALQKEASRKRWAYRCAQRAAKQAIIDTMTDEKAAEIFANPSRYLSAEEFAAMQRFTAGIDREKDPDNTTSISISTIRSVAYEILLGRCTEEERARTIAMLPEWSRPFVREEAFDLGEPRLDQAQADVKADRTRKRLKPEKPRPVSSLLGFSELYGISKGAVNDRPVTYGHR